MQTENIASHGAPTAKKAGLEMPTSTTDAAPGPAPLGQRRSASELPLRYFDGASVLAFFAVDRAAAEAKIDTRKYRLGMHWRGKAIVGMGFYQFRKSTIGSYNEVGIAVPVLPLGMAGPRSDVTSLTEMLRPAKSRRTGLYVLNLPVTTETGRAAGADHWGYPKFVTTIEWKMTGSEFSCQVVDPIAAGESVVRLAGTLSRGLPGPAMDQVLYSDHDQKTLRTEIEIGGKTTVHTGSGLVLQVGKSAHPMAENLRSLGLNGAKPALVMQIQQFTSVLPAGVAV